MRSADTKAFHAILPALVSVLFAYAIGAQTPAPAPPSGLVTCPTLQPAELIRIPEIQAKDGKLRGTMVVSAEQECIGFRFPAAAPAAGNTIKLRTQWSGTVPSVETIPPPPPHPKADGNPPPPPHPAPGAWNRLAGGPAALPQPGPRVPSPPSTGERRRRKVVVTRPLSTLVPDRALTRTLIASTVRARSISTSMARIRTPTRPETTSSSKSARRCERRTRPTCRSSPRPASGSRSMSSSGAANGTSIPPTP